MTAIKGYADRLRQHGSELGWILLGHAAAFIGGIIGVKVLTMTLGTAGYGTLALGLSVAGLLNSFLHNPFSNAVARFVAPYRDQGKQTLFYRTLLGLQGRLLMLMPVVAVLLVGVTTLLSSWYWGLLVASGVWYGAATGAAVSFQAWQNAARDRRSATTAQIADVWLRIAIAIVLVQLVPDGRLAVAGYAIGSGLVALWQYARARRALHAAGTAVVTDHEQEDSRQEFIRFSLPFAGYALFTVVSLYGDRWLLQQFDGVVAVGIYAAIYQLAASPVNILFAIVNQLMIPLVYEQAGVAGSGAVVPAARRLIVVTVWGVLAVLTVGGVLLSIFQYWVVALCTASSFVPYASLLVLVFWGLGLFQLGQILTLYGNCAGLPGIYLLAKIVHAVALGIFGVMLIPRMGVFGMGWALVAASLLYLMAIVLVNRRLAFSSGGCHV